MQTYEAGQALLLNTSAVQLVLLRGGADLFAVALQDGVPKGAREHLCRIGPGALLRGLDLPAAAHGPGLLALFMADTEAVPLAAGEEAAAGLTDGWLLALTSSIRRARPRDFHSAAAGQRLTLDAGASLYPLQGVCWIEAADARLRWQPAGKVMPGLPFPLTATTWAEVQGSAVHDGDQAGAHDGRALPAAEASHLVDCCATAALGGRLAPALAVFHRALLDYLHERQQFKAHAVSQRLLKKQQADAGLFRSGVAHLAGALALPGVAGAPQNSSGDALTDAFQLVARAAGISQPIKAAGLVGGMQQQALQIAHQSHLALRRVQLNADLWWRRDCGPLLVFRAGEGEAQQPLALLPASDHGYLLADPQDGSRRPLDAALATQLSPQAFMFYRSFPERAQGLFDVLRFGFAGSGADRWSVLLCGAVGGLLGLIVPVATGLLIDDVIPNAQIDQLRQLILMLGCAVFAGAAFQLTQAFAWIRIDSNADTALQSAVMDRLVRLPASFFRDYSAGDLAQRVAGLGGVVQYITNTAQSALLTWVFGVFSYASLFVLSIPLALVATALVAVALVFSVTVNVFRLRIERKIAAAQGAIASRVFQLLNGIAKIRTGGAERRAFALWAQDYAAQKSLDIQSRRISNFQVVFDAAFSLLCSMALFAAVAYVVPGLSTGRFLAFNAAFLQFFASTLGITGALVGIISVIPVVERARPILTALPEAGEVQAAPGELWGGITLNHVRFKYQPDGQLILDDLSMTIRPGEFVAFVGPSGSGKSTLLRLLLGFEKPLSGMVAYDGKDLAGLDVTAVRRQIGVVLQSGRLMPGDIFTNIVGASALTLDDAWEAARMAGLAEDIEAMPMGMHTVIAEGAGTISGGQRQRLMVARAIVRKPRILLFDEATSALDNRTQAVVSASIETLNATRIVIAHRLSTVMRADRILFIEDGQVKESGTYAELMAQQGRFYAMAQRQLA